MPVLHFAMMLDMLRGSDVSEALSRKKPWSQMTDDEKLVATLLFMVLFAAQLIFLVPLTLVLGLLWADDDPIDVLVRGPRLLLNFAPALTGVVAALSSAWEPLRRSGQWIWVPAVLFYARHLFSQGVSDVPRQLFRKVYGEGPLEIVATIPVVACILYSLTMFAMKYWIKRSDSQSKESSEPPMI